MLALSMLPLIGSCPGFSAHDVTREFPLEIGSVSREGGVRLPPQGAHGNSDEQ